MKPDIFPLILIRAAGLPSDTLRLDDERLSAAWETCGRSETERQNRHSALQHALSEVLAHLPEGPERSAVYNLRKRLHQQPHHLPAPDWMSAWQAPEAQAVREKIRDLQAAHERLRAACAAWEGEYEHTWQAGLSALRHIATDTEVVGRSLLFSSHDLLSALPPFASGPSGDGQKDRAAALSLLAYVSRAVYKTTPLSAWASIGVWRPALSADEAPPFGKNIVTPNVELLPLLYEALLQEPVFCQSLQIRLNPSYSPAQSWLHSDGRREAFYQGQRAALDAIVNWMTDSGGRMPYAALKNRLLDNIPEASDNAAHAFLKHCTELGLIEWIWPEAGLSAGWCGQLYNFLGYLPSAEMLTQAAFLLQWLRTTARTLPFQTLAEAQAAQQAAHEQTQHFFGKYLPGTPLPRPEHLFYLDAGRPPQVALPPDAVTRAAAELRACWLLQTTQQQPRPYALLTHYARQAIPPKDSMDALDFCRGYIEQRPSHSALHLPPVHAPRFQGKIGATLEFFKTDEGEFRAVVNGLFPGGGKMYARWAHLLPADFRDEMLRWADLPAFSWQGCSNANFQPASAPGWLALPGDRAGAALPDAIRLGDCVVVLDEHLLPQLIDRQSGKAVACTDLGLEAPDAKPPAIQVLWQLTVPQVSADMLLPPDMQRPPDRECWGWRLPRQEWAGLVLRRAGWQVDEQEWRLWLPAPNDDRAFFRNLQSAATRLGLPAHLWASWPAQHGTARGLCLTHPLLAALLHKMLRQGGGPLLLTEMLPSPDQYLASSGGHCATEFAIEFSTL